MKKLVKFETYLNLEENFIVDFEDLLNEELKLNEGAVGQVLGWVFVPAFMALRQGIRFAKKRQKIRNAVRNESDPKKKEALRKSLKELKYEELRAKEKVDQKKKELQDKIKQGKANMTPKEKEQYNKEKAKKQAELDKAEAKFKKEMEEFHGFEV